MECGLLFGYGGKILHVDLDHKKTEVSLINKGFCQKYIGGNGFAIRLLYDNTKAKLDPFDRENTLIFAVGPFAGTALPTSGKYIVQAKSPLTGFMGEAISSGMWGQTLKRAGYDAVVIKGKAEKPTYLFVDDDDIYLKDASGLLGQDCIETSHMIVKEIGDENVCVASIGPAGERLVRFACITNDRYRQAGRTGMGAVMGSKNLKAFAVRGTKKVEVANLEKLMEVSGNLYKKLQTETGLINYGTPRLVLSFNQLGSLPTRNFQQSTFELAENISGEHIREHYAAKTVACSGCPIGCDHISVVKGGPYNGEVASMEFETIYALGSECGIGYYPAIVKATNLCDRLGMDTISTGVTIGWAMECFERGLLTKEDTGGIDLTFGNHAAQLEIIEKIAYRDGIGDLLAEGVKKASEKTGQGSEHFAMHNKGLELPAYELRGLKASALGMLTSTRGGCHLRSMPFDIDLMGKVDRFKADPGIGEMVKNREDIFAVVDSLILCKFMRRTLFPFPQNSYEEMAEFYTLTTGIEMSAEMLRKAGERIYNLEKAYNVREGWTKRDDYPPPRMMTEPVPDGPAKGSILTEQEFGALLSAYFEARGWSSEGIPRKRKLIELGLEDAVENAAA
jgi:aldehyde:ferredoxin oxidoreductase